jgi:hypothetical protein
MARFEQLQNLWQQQPVRTPVDAASLTRSLRVYGRRQNLVSLVKMAVVAGLLGWAAFHLPASAAFRAGFGLIAAGALLMLVVDWRSHREIATLEFSAPSVAFAQMAVQRLAAQRNPFQRTFWIFLAAVVAGNGLMWWGKFHSRGPLTSALLQLLLAAVCVGGFRVGMRIRRWRLERESAPLIAQLTAFSGPVLNARSNRDGSFGNTQL